MIPIGFGMPEIVALLLIAIIACCCGRRGVRWLAHQGPLLLVAAAAPWPDLVTMMIIYILLRAAFEWGRTWDRTLRQPAEEPPPAPAPVH
jgi:hypothetical protein